MEKTILALVTLAGFMTAASSLAKTSDTCGDAPPVANESLKADIKGKAQVLSRLIGNAELGGKIETSRSEIFSKYPDAEQTRSNAYLESVVCNIIMADPSLSTRQKLDQLKNFWREFRKTGVSPSGKVNSSLSRTAGIFTLSLLRTERVGDALRMHFQVENSAQNAEYLTVFGKGSYDGGSKIIAKGKEYLAKSVAFGDEHHEVSIRKTYYSGAPILAFIDFNNIPSDLVNIELLLIAYSGNNARPSGAFESRNIELQ